MRFTGAFGQPDGFGSVLEVLIKQDGRLCITLEYGSPTHGWTIELDNQQKEALLELLSQTPPPNLFERILIPEEVPF